jgi:endonuclease/exonuclease/phosphatase (EEP) superfamily protein YafD
MQLMNKLLRILLYGVLIVLTIISIGILFWRSYPLELLCNFRVYYCLLAGGLTIVFGIYQFKRVSVKLPLYLSLGLLAFNSIWILPWYLPNTQQGGNTQQRASESIRVLTFNINIHNEQWNEIAKAIQFVKPDIATIIETSPKAEAELSTRLTNLLPFHYRTSGGGITILSRLPLIQPQSKTFESGTVLVTSVQAGQKELALIATHPIVPVKPRLFRRRNALLAEMATYIQKRQQQPLIFLGDFNLTPWSPYYQQLVKNTKLQNTRLGFGIEPSWIEPATHVRYPSIITALIKIPIDHIFVSKDFKVTNCRTMNAANSDHRMLWSDLVL